MEILSPAKINLFLKIGAREKGFHRLVSLVDIIDICDLIQIKEYSRTKVKFHSPWSIPAENTVTKVLSALKSHFNVNHEVRIDIFKKIPPGSGMGGGSSNAASVLKGLVQLWNLPLSSENMMEIGAEIGKDVPLFIYGRRCILRGFGEKITEAGTSNPLAYHVLVPPFAVSTSDVYKNFDILVPESDLTGSVETLKLLSESMERGEISKVEKHMENSLEVAYLDLQSHAKEVKKSVYMQTGKKVFVSGSGGTLFSIFQDRKEAEEKMRLLNLKGWTKHIAESIKTS